MPRPRISRSMRLLRMVTHSLGCARPIAPPRVFCVKKRRPRTGSGEAEPLSLSKFGLETNCAVLALRAARDLLFQDRKLVRKAYPDSIGILASPRRPLAGKAAVKSDIWIWY